VTFTTLQAHDFKTPGIVLTGPVDQAMYATFRDQLNRCPEQGLCVVELSTLGGDPEVARLMGEDVRFNSDLYPERRIVFLGKAAIYSAGTTFMSFFARQNRYLTRGTRLMIHERLMSCSLQLNGPLTSCIASVQAKLNELEASIAIQNEGFAELVRGSNVSLEDVVSRAPSNWYIDANEAVEMGLVEAVI
jgi:ATP-dependent protease ClpP protease subunit